MLAPSAFMLSLLHDGAAAQLSAISTTHPVAVRGGWPVPDAITVR